MALLREALMMTLIILALGTVPSESKKKGPIAGWITVINEMDDPIDIVGASGTFVAYYKKEPITDERRRIELSPWANADLGGKVILRARENLYVVVTFNFPRNDDDNKFCVGVGITDNQNTFYSCYGRGHWGTDYAWDQYFVYLEKEYVKATATITRHGTGFKIDEMEVRVEDTFW